MARNNDEITQQDIHDLVDAIMKDEQIKPTDLFRTIKGVRPSISKDFWKVFWIPLFWSLTAIVGMLFSPMTSPWFKLSLILFVLDSIFASWVLNHFQYKSWWVVFYDLFILYIVFAESLSWKELAEMVKSFIY